MNPIQKILNFFKPKEKSFYERVKALDEILTKENGAEILPLGPVEGYLVFGCTCGQSANVPVGDISIVNAKLWVCPKPHCRGAVSLIERRAK